MKTFSLTLLIILMIFSKNYSQDFWERTDGLDSMTIYSLAINSNGDIFAGTDTNGVFRSTDNGDTWTNLGLMNLKTPGIVIKPSGEIMLITLDHNMGGGVFLSTNNGNNWIPSSFTHAGSSIAINSNGHIFVGTLSIGVFRSLDNGENWVQVNQGLSDPHPTSFIVNTIGDIFAGTIFGGVFRSTDNGDNWIQINQGITNYQILSLGTNSNGAIFAGTSGGGAFRSINNGASWVQINQGLTNGQSFYVFSFAVDQNGDVIAGTAGGAFRSTNNGENWIDITSGLTDDGVLSLAINTNGDIFAGTEDGIFRSLYSTTSIDTTVIKIISSFKLYQNHPNPFNPSTTIRFSVSRESNVNLSIYNVLGELVSTLVDEQLKEGYYEYEFNSNNLASGIYIYRIKADNFVETKKMVLLR